MMAGMAEPVLYFLDESQFDLLERLCDMVVPGSRAAGPAVYIDSVLADMPEAQAKSFVSAMVDVGQHLDAGGPSTDLTRLTTFGALRGLVIEAYYSDFRRPGYDGPGAWAQIGFTSAPMAARAKQDWTFLRCYGGAEGSST